MLQDGESLATAAAEQAAASMRDAIAGRGNCRIVVATGASQLPFLRALTKALFIDWSKVEMFHLDEYVGMPATHAASFRKYLLDHFISKTGITRYHFVEGDASDLDAAIGQIGKKLNAAPIDVAFVGIGENGHVAFNDPPANFETEDPYIIVQLDEACRKQQVGEGWFANISEVPTRAISMSPRQIMKARQIISVVPDKRKAKAVRLCLEGEISPKAPASILRRHPNVTVYLDRESASQLSTSLKSLLDRESQAAIPS
ncbi:MAG TPA: glucosamine-6-phosphate deaminase [Candidatus Sulfotelmatobacter sp.]|nr:glucosamine-6-phosphate deaminase [Candidatus Sulfotelmatobacter sp.]